MAEDIKIKIGTEVDDKELEAMKKTLEDIKKLSTSIELNPKAKNRFDTASKAASIALEGAIDPVKAKAFKENLNILFNILSQAVKTNQKIAPEYEQLEKTLQELKERRGKLKHATAELNQRISSKTYDPAEATVLFEKGRKLQENDIFKGRDSASLIQEYFRVFINEAKEDLRKVTDDMAKNIGGREGMRYIANTVGLGANQIREENTEEQKNITAQITDIEAKLKTMSPVLEADNTALEDFLRQLYKLKGIATEQSENLTPTKPTSVSSKTASFDNTAVSDTNTVLEKQHSTLGKVFKRWTLYNIALRAVKKAVREAVSTIKELDKALTEQAMVTGLTRKQTYELLSSYQDMAKSLGATTREVASTMTSFLRQGRSIADSTKLTEAAIAAAKVASISTADSVNYLTTAINGFRLSAEDAMRVSDKFAAVAATAATSYEEIAIAMSKVAAQANLAGMSIDYTTALLTKGLETTREAPETIGTALKTVIARMRELTDYGATLEDGMNINNVEKQLSYVGIALREENGELRSTEDVLNDLGKQWDQLSSNQQAAIAKALAGTRQQSRLIAMMSDYERVLELQEIAERSQGATMAQMSTYLEGMDAALNKVNIAWESIVSAVTSSDFLIGLVNGFSNLLDTIGAILSSTTGLVTAFTIIGALGLSILGNKIREWTISRQQQKIVLKQQLIEVKRSKILNQNRRSALETLKIELLQLETAIAKARTEGKDTTELEAQLVALKNKYHLTVETSDTLQKEIDVLDKESELYDAQEESLNMQLGNTSKMVVGFSSLVLIFKSLVSLGKSFNLGLAAAKLYQEKLLTGMDKEAAKRERNNLLAGKGMFAHIVSAFASAGIPGIIAGIALATGLVAALGLGIAASAGAFRSSAEKQEDDIGNLSAEIYKLSEKSNKLNTVVSKFEEIDNQVLRTNEDLKEMNDLLNSVSDSLSSEEKEKYESLQTDKQRLAYLKEIQERTQEELKNTREEQREKLSQISADDIKKSMTLTDSLYALNNQSVYDVIDTMNLDAELGAATRKLTESLLSEMSVETQKALLNNTQKVTRYTETMRNLAETLSDTNLTLREQAQAYKKAYLTLSDAESKEAFKKANESWITFSELSEQSLDYIDQHYQGNIDHINQFTKTIQDLGYTSKQSLKMFEEFTQKLSSGVSLENAIADIVGETKGSAKYRDFLNEYEKAFNTGILNIGQNIKAFQSTIDNFYEKATKWNTLDSVEKTQFINENSELFKGETGDQLIKALETGNFALMQQVLNGSEYLENERQRILGQIEHDLATERAKEEKEQDKATIKFLEEQKKRYSSLKELATASLELRLKQEQEALNAYKDYLNKEQQALEESLNKRKDAYQKYFDDINQEFEDQEYEEQAQMLISNITKLGSTDSAASQQKQLELQRQLEDLEKERLQTLRERAQEQVLNNIDSQIEDINKKFDDLLNSQQLLLQAMLDDTSDTTTFATNYLSRTLEGATYNEALSALDTFRTTFGSYFSGLDNIRVTEDSSGNVYITIGDETINLTSADGQDIVRAVQEALKRNNRSVGLGRR